MVTYTGVITTGIYCRSVGCPATPHRRNVVPFDHPAAAEAAGFRPCLRCRPDRLPDVGWIAAPELVCRAMHSIADGALDDATEDDLATRLGVSARHLRRLFARVRRRDSERGGAVASRALRPPAARRHRSADDPDRDRGRLQLGPADEPSRAGDLPVHADRAAGQAPPARSPRRRRRPRAPGAVPASARVAGAPGVPRPSRDPRRGGDRRRSGDLPPRRGRRRLARCDRGVGRPARTGAAAARAPARHRRARAPRRRRAAPLRSRRRSHGRRPPSRTRRAAASARPRTAWAPRARGARPVRARRAGDPRSAGVGPSRHRARGRARAGRRQTGPRARAARTHAPIPDRAMLSHAADLTGIGLTNARRDALAGLRRGVRTGRCRARPRRRPRGNGAFAVRAARHRTVDRELRRHARLRRTRRVSRVGSCASQGPRGRSGDRRGGSGDPGGPTARCTSGRLR